ncbi:MAG TPA: 3-hydroxyacyl-CoA dehydrogenase family protein [Thermoleophilaceae bacterium]|nr:3-hydroxyacyl-CoA dehydrogenase family protein [Thermoleophilaceae bacterium]
MSQSTLTERLGIVGSGAIARGLAQVADTHPGVVMWARSEHSANRVRERLGDHVDVVTDIAELAESTLVIEAVVEDLEVKRPLLAELGALLPSEALIASTTSSLSVEELGVASGRPERFAGIHVFNPVPKMALVELVFPAVATDETRSRARSLCEALGKQPVEVPDLPGFVVNRLLFPYLFSAVKLLEDGGLEPEAIDTCMKMGAGHPMGPLALLDFVGLDVSTAIGETLGVEIPATVRQLMDEGKLGRKSGAGFYDYSK